MSRKFSFLLISLGIFLSSFTLSFASGTGYIIQGQTPTVAWSVTGVSSCNRDSSYPNTTDGVYNAWAGPGGSSGSITLPSVQEINTRSFWCTDNNTGTTDTVNLVVYAQPALSASCAQNGSTFDITVTWPAANANYLANASGVTYPQRIQGPSTPTGATYGFYPAGGASAADGVTGTSIKWTGLTAGNYSIWGHVYDPSNGWSNAYTIPGGVTCAAAPAPKPDLIVGGISPTSGVPGSAMTLSATVTNNGAASTPTVTNVTNFQWSYSSSGSSPTNLGSHSATGALAVGGSYAASVSFTAPAPGSYYVRACTDYTGVVDESNEGNNCGSSWTLVTIGCTVSPNTYWNGTACTTPPPPTVPNDSQCVSITAPSSVTPGQVFSATIVMSNTGTNNWDTANTTNPWRLGSQDTQDNTTWGTNRLNLTSTVLSGNNATFTANFTAPSTVGTYNFDWQMVQEYLAWFGAKCTKTITVANTAPSSCTAQGVNWGTGNSCAAVLSAGSGSQTVNADPTKSASGYTGSATYTCSSGSWTGPTNATCSQSQTAVNGACGASQNTCIQGSYAGDGSFDGFNNTWTCNGSGGGTNASCSENVCSSGSSVQTVTGANPAGGAWGTDMYTDDSNVPKIAVHAGITTIGQSAVVKTTEQGWQASFTGSTRNGVTTASYGGFCGMTIAIVKPDLKAGTISPTSATQDTAKTFSATITNSSQAPTGASFSNFFQVATGSNGSGTITDLPASSMSALAANGSASASVSYTFPSGGTYSMRVCADKTDRNDATGDIDESNEGNNCGGWKNITVTGLPDLVAGPVGPTTATTTVARTFTSKVINNGSVSTGAGFTNLFQLATGPGGTGTITDVASSSMTAKTSGSSASTTLSYTFSTPGTYSLRACADKSSGGDATGVIGEGSNENNNCGAWTDIVVGSTFCANGAINFPTCNQFTIFASNGANGTVTPTATTTVTQGNSQTYAITPAAGYGVNVLTVDGSSVAASTTYTFSNVQANHTISATFKVVNGSLTVSPTSCVIAAGASTCTSNATWTTTGVLAARLVDANVNATLSQSLNQASPGLKVWVAYPSTKFNLKSDDSGSVLDTKTVTATCDPSSAWDGTKCTLITGDIIPNSCSIANDQGSCSMNVVWSVSSPTSVEVRRNYDNGSVAATGQNGNQSMVFTGPPGAYTLDLYNASANQLLDSADFTVSCTTGGWDTIGLVCADPSVVSVIVTGEYYSPQGTLTFTCSDADRYVIKNDSGTQIGSGFLTNGKGTFNVTGSGNYSVICKHGSLESLPMTRYYNAAPPPPPIVSVTASPKTLSKGTQSIISWAVQFPVTACAMTAKSICTNDKCTSDQIAAQDKLNSIIQTGYTDESDIFQSRPIKTAVNTIAPGRMDIDWKALGKKTFTINNTTDFTINCGNGRSATTRVQVTNSNEQ